MSAVGIEPTTSRSSGEHSPNWVKPTYTDGTQAGKKGIHITPLIMKQYQGQKFNQQMCTYKYQCWLDTY